MGKRPGVCDVPKTAHRITIDVEVHDPEALYVAAQEAAIRERMRPEEADAILRPDGEIDVDACLQMLADPGVSWPGTEIQQSTCCPD